jgi:hypothetical protein
LRNIFCLSLRTKFDPRFGHTDGSTKDKRYMRTPRTINFALHLLLVLVIEMAAFFYFSAEPGIFPTPLTVRSQSHASCAQQGDEEREQLSVQFAILGYDANNIPFVEGNVENTGICEGDFNLLLSHVICPSVLFEKLDAANQSSAIRNISGFPSRWNSSLPIAFRQLLI